MVYLVLGTICIVGLLVFVGVLASRGPRHARERVLIFYNGRLLQEDTDYTLDARGTPTFNIPIAETDILQRIRLHGTFVRLRSQDYHVRNVAPRLSRIEPFVAFTPPQVAALNSDDDLVRRIQEAFAPLDVSRSARSAPARPEATQEPAAPRFERDLDV